MLTFIITVVVLAVAVFITRAALKETKRLREETIRLGAMVGDPESDGKPAEGPDWLSTQPVIITGDLSQDSLWERRD